MKLGVVLPSFRRTADATFAAAAQVEQAGLDGVFLYDHLWPLGEPGRPAISPFPLLGALAALTTRVMIGTLVARVGLVPDDVLLNEIRTTDLLSVGRFIAGLGTGDSKSAAENLAYGVRFAPAVERLETLVAVVEALVASGITTWIGGRSARIAEVAHERSVALNLWAASPAVVAREATMGEVTWGGILPATQSDAVELLSALEQAGASWAVVGWQGSITPILDAAKASRVGPFG